MKTNRFPLIACVPVVLTLTVSGCMLHSREETVTLPTALLHDPGLATASLRMPGTLQTSRTTIPNSKLTETSDQAKTATVTAQIMARDHYLNHPLDAEMSSKIFDEYVNTLDPRHVYFLASDIKEFEPYRTKLGELMTNKGDVTPAFLMFTRLLERLDQEDAYVIDFLKTDPFTFTGNDVYLLDRKTAPHPADEDAAKQQWREFLRYQYLQEKLNKHKPEEIIKTLTKRYERQAKTLHGYDTNDVFEMYLNALAHAYDPHSDYLGKSAQDNFNIQMNLSVFGIGAMLQSEDGYAKIMELTPGGPALKSGKLKAGDRIAGVAQGDKEPVDVFDMKLDKVVEMIRGPKGTHVRLTVIPADAPDPSTRKVIELVRDEVKLEDQEAKAKVIDMPLNGKTVRMGVIDLPSFYADFEAKGGKSTTKDVARLIKKLEEENVSGIILDLRRNPGGSLKEVIDMAGLFIKAGAVVQVKSSTGEIQVDKHYPDGRFQFDSREDATVYNTNTMGVRYDGPLVVLTSRGSASASEILAGALQDYGRALIVGDTSTFGKGTVQTVLPLGQLMQRNHIQVTNDPGALKLTIEKFYRVSGSSTQFKGVVPDIILPSLTNYVDIGEKTLDNPLPFDTIPSAAYQKVNLIAPILPELKKRSDARIASDKDFAYLRQEIGQFKKMIAEKSVSLNEEQRLKEKHEAEARVKGHQKELKARTAPKEKVYLVTLKNYDKPGLTLAPPPKSAVKAAKANTGNPDASDDTAGGEVANLPAIDTTLQEGERILEDMLNLSGKQANKAVVKSGR